VSDNPTAPAIQSLVAEIVSGYVKKNQIAPADIPMLINTVYQSLTVAGKAPEPEQPRTPAVPIRQSVRPNCVVCLDCGWRGRMLRRHVHSAHGLTPEQYRARWKLSPDYPLTAPAYSEQRSSLAKKMGLGRRPKGRRPTGSKAISYLSRLLAGGPRNVAKNEPARTALATWRNCSLSSDG
jgi:predicted transcriptional regulator